MNREDKWLCQEIRKKKKGDESTPASTDSDYVYSYKELIKRWNKECE